MEEDTESDEEFTEEEENEDFFTNHFIHVSSVVVGEDASYVDALTGGMSTRPSVKVFDKTYDLDLICEYLLMSKNLREPRNVTWTKAELDILKAARPDIGDRLDFDTLDISPVISCTSFFMDRIATINHQMRALCEIESMTSLFDVRNSFLPIHEDLIRCFSALLRYNPMEASNTATLLKANFAEILAIANDDMSQTVLFEPMATAMIVRSILQLTKIIHEGLFNSTTEVLINEMHIMKPRAVQSWLPQT